MCGKLIYVVIAILGLLLVDNFFPFLAPFVCGLFIYFYISIFSSDFKDRRIASLVIKAWGVVSFLFLLWKYIILIIRNIFTSKKHSVKSKSFKWEHCENHISLEKEIDVIVSKISEHYLHAWYDNVSPDEEFILQLNSLIKSTLLRLCSKVNTANHQKVLNVAIQMYLHFFIHFIEEKKKSNMGREVSVVKHWALQDKTTEWCYLQSLMSFLINHFVHPRNRNEVHSKYSPVIHNLIVEILTQHIVFPLLNLISDPHQLNFWILKVLETYIENNGGSCDFVESKHQVSFQESSSSTVCSVSPKILLEAENNSTNFQNINQKQICESKMPVPNVGDSFALGTEVVIDQKVHFEQASGDCLSPFVASTIKSSSNFNLFEKELLSARASKSEVCSPVSCDVSTIKRSKSADYIRQIPQLRTLSARDYNSLLKNRDKPFSAMKSDCNFDCSVETAEEAVELPTLFSDVKIWDTVQEIDDGTYTLYCIKYLGLFHDTDQSAEKPHFIKQEVNIKRRFREFLALQSRLEDNQSLKNALKGIRGPSKWLALPFSNMDKKNIAERKSFLENYLKELCNQVPIAQSAELQEFLAYGGDGTAAFVKKAADISVPRIDKILVRGVKGAIDMFKTALPNSVEGVYASDPAIRPNPEDSTLDHRFPEHLLEYSSREPELRFFLDHYEPLSGDNQSLLLSYHQINSSESDENPLRASILRHIFKLKVGNACQCFDTWNFNDKIFECEDNPLGNLVADLLIESLKYREIKNLHLFSILKFLLSPSINRCLVAVIDQLTEENLALFLHVLHEALWPCETDNAINKDTQKSVCGYDLLKQYLKVFISMNIPCHFQCLQNWIEEHMLLFLSSIQSQNFNRCFLLHLFDMIIQEMFSETT